MSHPVVNPLNTLNSASPVAARRQSPYGGADFAAINALAIARRAPGGDEAKPQPQAVAADRLLNDLNNARHAPAVAATAPINSAVRSQEAEEHAHAQEERHEELTRQAQKLVSHTFFGPMLRQMRNSPFKNELFDGGRGGQVFHAMFDQHLADRMAGSANNKLVSALVRQLEGSSQPAPRPANPYQNVRIHVAATS